MAFAKEVPHQLRLGLRDSKIRADVAHHLPHVHRTDTAQSIGLHILVQQFIRIQFRTVGRQPENSNLPGMLRQPSIHRPRFVHRVAISNQKHSSPRFPRQSQEAAKKIQKHPRGEALTENHERQPAPISDRGDHVAPETLTSPQHNRRLPATSVGSPSLMVGTQSHLVQPMNLRLIPPRQPPNRGVFFLQPFPHGSRVLFVSSPHRFLRSQTPGPQITSHRPHRDFQIEFSGQQRLHRFSGPQGKGQAQLIGASAHNITHCRGCLMRRQPRNRRPPSTPCFQRPASGSFQQPHPPVHRAPRHSEDPRRFGLRKTLLNGFNDSPAKVFLSFARQRAGILFFHAPHTTTSPSICHLYYALISSREFERRRVRMSLRPPR